MVRETTLINIQNTSGLLFSSYLSLHLSNHLAAFISEEACNSYQHFLRKFYQTPAVEYSIIGGALVTHASVGIIRFLRRRRQQQKVVVQVPFSLLLHRISAAFLLSVMGGHIFFTRINPSAWFNNGKQIFDGNLNYVYYTLQGLQGLFFVPYYSALFGLGFYHMFYGLNKILFDVQKKTGDTTVKRENIMSPWKQVVAAIGIATGVTLIAYIKNMGLSESLFSVYAAAQNPFRPK